ncbi:MAG TPA: NADH-quinone oxidoreductase subunit J [Gemmatales bacterium]|nr:NADH-quinone oxidoreductase subunit J [Gemmatales bacterium]HMP59298.1 NADH-quinone oxidoreductase subunit J [Gemmatales bacterium]
MDLAEFLFWTVGALTCLSAVMVAAAQSIVRAAVWLLFTLAGVSGLYFLLGADFLGAVQLIVYVGGILILVIFGVMLTAQGPLTSIKTPAGEWAISLVVGFLMLGLLVACILATSFDTFKPTTIIDDPARARTATDLGLVLVGVKDSQVQGPADLNQVPGRQREGITYVFPFEILSVHLVVVLIGAAYLARAKRRRKEQA